MALADTIPGPIPADVVRVIDGDTFDADAHPWPGMTIRIRIRLESIDAAEMRGKCPAEIALAIKARDRLKALVGDVVQLVDVRRGKYAGRVLAGVLVDGKRVGTTLIAEGLARPYSGGKREGWCDD